MLPVLRKHDWLHDKQAELDQLLYDDCKDEHQIFLVLSLIDRIVSLDDKMFREHLKNIIRKIKQEPNFEEEKTVVVPLSGDRSPDSGQLLLYAMKPIWEDEDISLIKTYNRYTYLEGIITKAKEQEINKIILVDEFLGSGKTLITRHKTIGNWLRVSKIPDCSITSYFVAAQNVGLEAVRRQGITASAEMELSRGISDSGFDVETEINRMKTIEEVLSASYLGVDLPSLGYGQVEALYRREGGNTPNSVFPIFWWRRYTNDSKRHSILTRNMSNA